MGSFNDLPNNPESDKTASEQLIDDIRQNLQQLKQDLVGELTADVGRLQAEKVELLSSINELKREQKVLQAQQKTLLSQQQIAQQKLWAKQLSEALANRLYVLLAQRIDQRAMENESYGNVPPWTMPEAGLTPPLAITANKDTQQALQTLNQKVNSALASVQSDLNQPNSVLIQQLSQGENPDVQGEVLLNQLVDRLKIQLRSQAPSSPSSLPSNGGVPLQQLPAATQGLPPMASTPPKPEQLPFVERMAQQFNLSHFQLGVVLVLLSTISLSLHNVVVGIIGNESSLFSRLPTIGGVVTLASLDSSLLLLLLRMVVVLPLMVLLSTFLYPPAWSDIKSFLQAKDRRLLATVVGSGAFLFSSQVLIYIAIGQVGPGIAVTLLFVYPIITVPLAWFFFSDRPTPLRWLVLTGVFFGIVLTMNILKPGQLGNPLANLSGGGIGIALLSGVFFAMYLISMQLSFRKLHPVPVSVIQFFTIFVLTSLILIVFPTNPDNINLSSKLGLFIGALVLGGLTLSGYLLNNFGIRYMGAARASIIASSGPALTALLGWIMVPERFSLQLVQWLGILLVTVCVASLSLERLFMQQKQTSKS
ncbi:MAG: EamA family transporter [Leptolyngbyaceae bacterium]|nr:EamA family transporter [Leptolyngbyaceae bacterium]